MQSKNLIPINCKFMFLYIGMGKSNIRHITKIPGIDTILYSKEEKKLKEKNMKINK